MFRVPMTLDATYRGLTMFACVLTALLLAVPFLVLKPLGVPAATVVGSSVSVFVGFAMLLSWAMSPRALEIDERELRVERRAWAPLHIPRASIAGATSVEGYGPSAVRLFGVGGFFGSYGLFWSRTLGRFRLYATRRGQAVIVRRRGEALPIVLTPDDVAGTIAAIAGARL
jgi:hypothetical protein